MLPLFRVVQLHTKDCYQLPLFTHLTLNSIRIRITLLMSYAFRPALGHCDTPVIVSTGIKD
jgi:hypothetical protein